MEILTDFWYVFGLGTLQSAFLDQIDSGRCLADLFRDAPDLYFYVKDRSFRFTITNRVWLVPNVNGTVTWYLSSKYPLFDRDGEMIGLAGLMRDCSQAGSLLGHCRNLSTAIEFIGQHFDQPITVGELAAMSHLSISQFERSFRKYFKVTPMKYVNQVRLDSAARLLTEGDQSIASIAQATGFYDHSYFTKQFRAAKGMSPSAYRKQMIGQQ